MKRRPIGLALLVATALLSCNATANAQSWNQWRGPTRDARATNLTLPTQLKDNLQLVWEKPLGPSYSGPVVSDGTLFVTETVDKQLERVTAFEMASGATQWQAEWPGSMSVPFFAAANGDWIRATPACDGEKLIVMGMRDVLVCLDASGGSEQWRIDFPAQLGTPLPAFGGVCSPLIDGQTVYLQTGGPTVAVDIMTGQIRWQALKDNGGMMSGGAFSSPVIRTVAGKRQLLVQTRTKLTGVEPESGKVLWEEPIEAFRGMNILTPTLIGDRIFTAAHSGRSQLFELTADGSRFSIRELWNQKPQGYMSSPVVLGNAIYLHGKNERMMCLDVETGNIAWTSRPLGKYVSMVAASEKDLLALTASGDLLRIEHSDQELNITDQVKVAEDSWAHLAVEGNLVIVRDLAAIKVFRLSTQAL